MSWAWRCDFCGKVSDSSQSAISGHAYSRFPDGWKNIATPNSDMGEHWGGDWSYGAHEFGNSGLYTPGDRIRNVTTGETFLIEAFRPNGSILAVKSE